MTAVWILAAFVYSSFLEWFLHRFVLHWLGKKSKNIFSFHWSQHHKTARKNGFKDKAYEDWDSSAWKEIGSLLALVLLHSPLWLIGLGEMFVFLCLHSITYFWIHRKCHMRPEWCKRWFPWHYKHHLGRNQDSNYGVTNPLFDYVFKTRE